MKKETGKHIIADLYQCNFQYLNKLDIDCYKKYISQVIQGCNLTEVGNFYKKFPNGSFSAVISLAESHLNFHTWPELDYISLDIYVCNYKKNNFKKADCLYQKMLDLFKPKKIKKQIILR